jgi:hypothetical protein
MSIQQSEPELSPWYKQGWPWALIAIPLLTILACGVTIYIAFNSDDSLVNDNYYKEGLAINQSIERIEYAKNISLIAKIEIDKTAKLLHLNLQSSQTLPHRLFIKFSHPTLQTKDQSFELQSLTGGDFVAELNHLEEAYWHVSLEDGSKTWLLKSRWLYPNKPSISIDANTI